MFKFPPVPAATVPAVVPDSSDSTPVSNRQTLSSVLHVQVCTCLFLTKIVDVLKAFSGREFFWGWGDLIWFSRGEIPIASQNS